jgi:hypothetical protein
MADQIDRSSSDVIYIDPERLCGSGSGVGVGFPSHARFLSGTSL